MRIVIGRPGPCEAESAVMSLVEPLRILRQNHRVIWRRLPLFVCSLCSVIAVAAIRPALTQQPSSMSTCNAAETAEACFQRGLRIAELSFERVGPRAFASKRTRLREQALRLFRSACSGGEGDACYFAGRLVVIARDSAATDSAVAAGLFEATDLFRLGCYARNPSATACSALGSSFASGMGNELDADSAHIAFERGCRRGNPSACGLWAFYVEDRYELGQERFDFVDSLRREACDDGSRGACMTLAYKSTITLMNAKAEELQKPRSQREGRRNLRFYREACAAGNPEACNNVGAIFADGRLVRPNGDSTYYYYRIACLGQIPGARFGSVQVGDGFACKNLGNLHLVLNTKSDTAQAVEYYRQGCWLTEQESCASLALYGYTSKLINPSEAFFRAKTECDQGAGTACNAAAWLLRQSELRDLKRSASYYALGCDLRHSWSCYQAGSLELNTFERRPRAAKYFRLACNLGEPEACNRMATLLETHGLREHALRFFSKSCELGDAEGCWGAVRLHATRHDDVLVGEYRAHACRLDRTYCKTKREAKGP